MLTILRRSTSLAETRLSNFPNTKHFGEAFARIFPRFSGVPFDTTNELNQLADITHHLDILEKSIETKITIERAAIDQSREVHEKRRDEAYDFLSIILGILVIFEVFGSFFSWVFPQGNIWGFVAWVPTLIVLLVVVTLSVRRARKTSNKS